MDIETFYQLSQFHVQELTIDSFNYIYTYTNSCNVIGCYIVLVHRKYNALIFCCTCITLVSQQQL